MSVLILSDIHGRRFWKDAVEKYTDKVDKIVAIGDYLDPYQWEGITRNEAIRNFQEIIDFKKENKDKVHVETPQESRQRFIRSKIN